MPIIEHWGPLALKELDISGLACPRCAGSQDHATCEAAGDVVGALVKEIRKQR
jgi:hypothetical protein